MRLLDSAKRLTANVARRALQMLNIEPALVKAVVRKPPVVHGGPRARRLPWPRRRHIGREEKRAVMRVIDKEIRRGGAIVYGGEEEKAYCDAFARYLGGGYAKAVNSGTNAVYVALKALDLEPGSEVVVPAITDPGGTMPVAMLNCIPIPADSERGSLNTSAEQIKKVLSHRTSAIVVAHISGHSVDMDPVLELARELHIPVVEDCAQAHGAVYKGRKLGSLGTISAFSTMFGKQHCTGAQGGVVFTKDTLLFARVRQISDRGKPYGALGNPTNLVASLNFNQDEISMAIGRVQLEKLPAAIQLRRAFVSLVEDGLRDVDGVRFIGDRPECSGSYWFLTIRIDTSKLGCDSHEFAAALSAEGIGGVSPGYPFFPTDQPWHRDAVVFGKSGMPWSAFAELPKPRRFELPNAHEASRQIVRVDVHESLGTGEARDLVVAMKKVIRYYSALADSVAGEGVKQAVSNLAPALDAPRCSQAARRGRIAG